MKTVEITTKYLEYYINFFDEAVAKFEKIDSRFERSPMWVKLFQTALHAREIFFVKGRVTRWNTLWFCLLLRNCHHHPNL